MHWSRYCLLAVFAGGTALALQIPRPVDDREWSPADTKESAGSIQDPELKGSWDDLVAGTGGGCNIVGANAEFFDRVNHYRGNSYRVTKTVTLARIGMLLGLNNSTELYVSVHRRQTNTTGPWLRYPEGSTDRVIQNPDVTGVANPIFHYTPELNPPLLLEAGYDYAIGYSWTSSLRYFKDLFQVYPNSTPADFDFGQVMGLVGLNPVTPPLADSLTISVSPNGAYAMSLCLTGACCTTSGNCINVSSAQCGSGQFTAAGVTCADLVQNNDSCPLPNGACCFNDTCVPTNFYDCDSRTDASVNWHELIPCGDPVEEPCAPRGGCCSSDGSCEDDLTVGSCTNLGGIYRGDGITCDALPPCSQGACCNTDDMACVGEFSRAACEGGGLQFSFLGPGTSCDVEPDPCIPIGACCNPTTGVCTDGLTEAQCEVGGRVFRGDGSQCEDLRPACGLGACCTADTGCEDGGGLGIDAQLCSAISGTFRGDGTTCATLNPACPGTCCRGTNLATCNQSVQPAQCTSLAGTFIGYGQTCPTQQGQSNPCSVISPSTGGACCLPSGSCSKVSTPTICTQLFGLYHPGMNCSQVSCVAPPPLGACCNRLVQSCAESVEEEDCAGFGRVWLEDANCDSFNPPCKPVGACCDQPNLTCVDGQLQENCPHTWTAGSRCDLLDPPCAQTGACCLGQTCAVETTESCETLGGRYLGDDSLCNAETCIPRGACCDGEQCLPNTTEAACEAIEGVYQGDDTTCEAGITCIPTGVCCTGQACDDTQTQESCQGIYRGDGTTCSPVNPCIPTGACCNGLGCSTSSEATCTGGGGVYAGDGSQCADSCDRGACCATTQDGCGCLGDQFEYECRDQGGLFFQDTDCEVVGKCPVEIVSADPRDCALDARQSPLGSGPAGEIDAILVKFSCDATGMTKEDLEIVQEPPQGTPLAIDHIMVDGTEVHVMFDGPIPLQVWTCVRHIASDTQTCVGYLPGDVNNNEISNVEDVSTLVAEMEAMHAAIPQLSLTSIQCDSDRSGACTPMDILRAIDLINGADDFASWNNAVPAAPCPSAAP